MNNTSAIEKKWQKIWEQKKTYSTNLNSNKKKFYVLAMLPYPSADGLHVGHVRSYTFCDVVARYMKANNYEVIHPMGWDAFGLPAEQYAIQTGNHPREFTLKNIANFKRQLLALGYSYDFEKEINTSDSNYFRNTQFIFSLIYKRALAKNELIDVNWCEGLGTVLANEEVLEDKNGNKVSERGSFPVTKKPMRQWVLRITEYAKQLVDELTLTKWSSGLKKIQYKWIGDYKSKPIVVNGKTIILKANDPEILTRFNSMVLIDNSVNSESTTIVTINHKKVSKKVSLTICREDSELFTKTKMAYISQGSKSEGSFIYFDKNIESSSFDNSFFEIDNMHLRDWIFSRQRYWGEPFPVAYDSNNTPTLIEGKLPIALPDMVNIKPGGDGKSPLVNAKDWVNVEVNGKKMTRETDTMPQWAGSCWYYLAYLIANNGLVDDIEKESSRKIFDKWLPVDLYVGGQEHAVLHLLYARFWHKILCDLNIITNKESLREPFLKIVNQGMITGSDGEKMSKSKGNGVSPDAIIVNSGADSLRLYEMFMGPLTSSMPWSENGIKSANDWIQRVVRLYENNKDNFKVNNSDIEVSNSWNDLIDSFDKTIDNIVNDGETEGKMNVVVSKMMIFINSCYKSSSLNTNLMKDFLIPFSFFCPHIAEELNETVFSSKELLFGSKWPSKVIVDISSQVAKYAIQVNGKTRIVIEVNPQASKDEVISIAKSKIDKNQDFKFDKVIFVPNKIVNFVS
jgi:leucyl-tRNA synthetase